MDRNDNFYFTKIIALPNGEALLCGHLAREEDDPTFTRLYLISPTGWRHVVDLPDVVYGLGRGTVEPGRRPNLFVLGRDGVYKYFSAGQPPMDGRVPKRDVTYLEAAAVIDGDTYVCGGQNQVFRWRAGAWEDVAGDIYQPFEGKLTASLEAMASRRTGDMLFVGDRGAVFNLRENAWHKIEVPTNVNLLCVTAYQSGYLIGGVDGVLLSLDASWQSVDLGNEETEHTRISSFAHFRGNMYAAASDKLLMVDERTGPQAVTTPNDPSINSIVSIDALDDYLWMTGGEQVLRSDGSAWEVMHCPDNK